MSNMDGVLKRQELFTCHEHLGSPPVFGGVRVAHLFSFLCCVVLFCFVCLRLESCVNGVASVSGLSILDCPIGFLYHLFQMMTSALLSLNSKQVFLRMA